MQCQTLREKKKNITISNRNRTPPSLLKWPSLRRASPSFQNLSPCHRSFQLRTMRNAFSNRTPALAIGQRRTALEQNRYTKLYIQSHVVHVGPLQLALFRSSLRTESPTPHTPVRPQSPVPLFWVACHFIYITEF
jgi:hypothetical protein